MKINYTGIDGTHIALSFILIAYIFFAVFTLNKRSANGDEFGTIWMASQNQPSDIITYTHKYDVHPPTHYLMLHYWGKIFSYSDFSMRLNSLVLLLVSFLIIWKLISFLLRDIDQKSKLYIFALCIFNPALFVIGSYARYYALGLLLSLLSVYFFLLWHSNNQKKQLILYILSTILIFYLHYFLALIIFLIEGTYFIFNYFKLKNYRVKTWLISQVIIVFAFLPILIWSVYPILSGQNDTLSGSAFEGLSGLKAIPISMAGQLFTIFNGAIVFPWTFWITIPQLFIFFYIIYLFKKKNRPAVIMPVVSFFIIPFTLIAVLITIILPFAGYFIGIFRAPFVIVTFWIFAGYIITNVINSNIKKLVLLTILICNLYSILIFGFNYYSMGQSPPLKEISYTIKLKTPEQNKALVITPWAHGWIKGHAILRYLPLNFIVRELKDNSGGGITIDSCVKLMKNSDIKNLWFIQPNRFSENLYILKQKTIEQRFRLVFKQDFTKQTDFDLWFKRKINNIPFLKFNNNSPKEYIYTIYNYKRD